MVSELSISFLVLTLIHPPTPRWSLCGRYASYWNAFFFTKMITKRTLSVTEFISLNSLNLFVRNKLYSFLVPSNLAIFSQRIIWSVSTRKHEKKTMKSQQLLFEIFNYAIKSCPKRNVEIPPFLKKIGQHLVKGMV